MASGCPFGNRGLGNVTVKGPPPSQCPCGFYSGQALAGSPVAAGTMERRAQLQLLQEVRRPSKNWWGEGEGKALWPLAAQTTGTSRGPLRHPHRAVRASHALRTNPSASVTEPHVFQTSLQAHTAGIEFVLEAVQLVPSRGQMLSLKWSRGSKRRKWQFYLHILLYLKPRNFICV